jgi:hypothetical protein
VRWWKVREGGRGSCSSSRAIRVPSRTRIMAAYYIIYNSVDSRRIVIIQISMIPD